jgi:choline kinase
MRAIILAAGRGARMRTLTDERPKCLVELDGRPLLDWQLAALRAAGISEIGIVTGYRRELLSPWALAEFYNARWEQTNMVASLATAGAWLEETACIVSYADIFYEAAAVQLLARSDAALAVTYDVNWRELWTRRFEDPLSDAETFRLGPGGRLLEIGRKPRSLNEIQGQYMGLLRFTPAAWSEVERIRNGLTDDERDRMHMTGTLQRVIDADRLPVIGIPFSGLWGEVDSPEDLASYQNVRFPRD